MKYDTSLQIRLDGNLKNQVQKVYEQIGLDLATAIRLFLQQSVIQNGLPFGMMNLDALTDTKNNTVSRQGLISETRALEVQKTTRTCRMAQASNI